MARYLLRRLLLFIPTIWVAVTLVFVIFRLVPGDPAQLAAGPQAPESVVETIRHQMGLDHSVPVQYVLYLKGLLHGDFGTSRIYPQGALPEIASRLPATLFLAAVSMLVATVLGIAAGIISALRPNSWVDRLSMLAAIGGVSFPRFWIGLMLILVFAVTVRWLPVAGFNSPAAIVLPALTLAASEMAVIARMMRSSMLGALGEDYIRTARAKGLPERAVTIRHAFRNALIPTMTIVGLQLGYLLGGSLVVESVFAWPGIGLLLIQAIQLRDYTIIQAVVIVYAVLMLATNLLVDLLYAWLDPRVSYG